MVELYPLYWQASLGIQLNKMLNCICKKSLIFIEISTKFLLVLLKQDWDKW